ncbi:hypothetical protein [Pseudonocardia acidicola]|uniref:Uncharacterized protein n=1 Tax=Pseudonocardia acidicola TaxID=2724939 RepID=A0ABX1S6J1_9PSEU|nr:hypothetical protein [Pseudonocardia acidicola]NMH97176.1 hypothetical protein [Pseudonocardia acidicola]
MSRSAEFAPPTQLTCRVWCRPAPALRAHHDQLLRVERDTDAMLDLFELAVTWAELEYPAETTIAPSDWVGFAELHRWQNPQRVLRIFSLATDVALSGPALRKRVGTPAAGLGLAAGSGLCPALLSPPQRRAAGR